jgi:hypothetical protein
MCGLDILFCHFKRTFIMSINCKPLLIFIVVSIVHLYLSRYSGVSPHYTVCYAVVVMKNYGYYEMLSVDILVIVAPTVAILRHFCNQDWKSQPCLIVSIFFNLVISKKNKQKQNAQHTISSHPTWRSSKSTRMY